LETIAIEYYSSCCEVNDPATLHNIKGLSKSGRENHGQDSQGGNGGQPFWSLSPEETGKYVMILRRISSLQN
jgi:hypothetical protein